MVRLACALATLALLSLTACSSSTPAGPAGPGPTLIKTDKGEVQGVAIEGARIFYAIPYAAPPVGALRWKAPQDAPPWSAPLSATEPGPACPGIGVFTALAYAGNEDCLTLNVWTPLAKPAKPAPVMVWIHGGGFVGGSGRDATYEGTNLAAKTGAIVVTLNYRLAALGFMMHEALGQDGGNLGLLDQRAALRWVQRNIEAFGGDPKNVTIFGESAGGSSVCAHLVMAGSRGLFHRAIMQSGGCSAGYDPAEAARAQGKRVADKLGCTDPSTAAACLRSKTPTELNSAVPYRRAIIGDGILWNPILDGVEMPRSPRASFETGDVAKVPVIVGTTRDEGTAFAAVYKDPITPELIAGILAALVGTDKKDKILAEYQGFATPEKQLSEIMTDAVFVCPTRHVARGYQKAGLPVYAYQFAYPIAIPGFPGVGATHSTELPFVFGTSALGAQASSEQETALRDTMQGYWGRFAASGDPNGGGAPKWPTYGAGEEHAVLDLAIGTGAALKKQRCDFWDTVY